MAALAFVLIGIVLLIALSTKDDSQPGGIQPHEHVFDEYYLAFDNGFFNVNGACSFEGCDEAKTLATGVAVSQLPIKPATCTENGQTLCVYSYNGTTLQYPVTVAKKSHNFAYTLNGNQLSGQCTNDDCAETLSATATSVVKKSEIAATCKDVAKTVYTATLADGTEVEVVAYGTDKLSKHTLNGSLMDTSIVYNYGDVAGITSNVECGKTGTGKFVCEVCASEVAVSVKKPNHKFKLDYTNAQYPTATKVGNIGINCQNDNCTLFNNENIQLPAIKVGAGGNSTIVSQATATSPAYVRYEFDALGIPVIFERIPYDGVDACVHEYANYSVTPNGTSGYYTVTATCIKPGCTDKNLRVTNATKVSETPATCQQVSSTTYLVNGKNVVINGTEKGQHDFVIISIVNPTATTKGSVVFKCNNAGCMFNSNNSTEIDEIKIGVNAIIISGSIDDGTARVKYKYESFFGEVVLENIPYKPD